MKEKLRMDNIELKELYKKTFDVICDGYGHSSMRFFSESTTCIPSHLNLKGNEHVLDVATGTGYAAFAIAKHLRDGKVTGIDFSKGMLMQAMRRSNEQDINNVDFVEMDMQTIDYPDEHFDAAVCTFGIFFAEEMKEQLVHIASKVKDGGTILITTFSDNAFSPLINLFISRLELYGIKVPSFAWKNVSTEEQCIGLFTETGLQNIQSKKISCGYYLEDVNDWWYIIWNGGYRGLVNQLSEKDFIKFKKEHLAEIKEFESDKGIFMEMNILYTTGKKKTIV